MTQQEIDKTLGDFTHFGTDMATWKNLDNGFTVIDMGFIYGITAEQYNPEEGDITRSRAKAILSYSLTKEPA